jgi:hypothetical protein
MKQLTSGKAEEGPISDLRASSLKTSLISPVIKISNVFEREAEMSAQEYEELL